MAWIEKTITDLTTKGSALIEEARVMVEQAEKLFDKSPLIRALAMVFAEIPRASEPAPAPETGGGKI